MDDRAAAEAEIADVEASASPIEDKDTGVPMVGSYPLNHRLRAEALAAAGEAEDPDALISPALIADAKGRLDGQAEAARLAEEERLKAFPPVHAGMKVADLERIAADSTPSIDLSSASNNEERVALIEKARQPENLNPLPPPAPTSETGDGAGGTGEAETKEA